MCAKNKRLLSSVVVKIQFYPSHKRILSQIMALYHAFFAKSIRILTQSTDNDLHDNGSCRYLLSRLFA